MPSIWADYLDRLEAALRSLHAGASWADFPEPADLGPLPDDLRERAESLQRAAHVAEASTRARRAAVAERLSALTGRRLSGRAIKA